MSTKANANANATPDETPSEWIVVAGAVGEAWKTTLAGGLSEDALRHLTIFAGNLGAALNRSKAGPICGVLAGLCTLAILVRAQMRQPEPSGE